MLWGKCPHPAGQRKAYGGWGLEGSKWKWLCFRNKKPGKRLQKFVLR